MLNSSFHCAQQRKAIAAIGPAREAAVGGRGSASACWDLISPNRRENCKRNQDMFTAASPVIADALKKKGREAHSVSSPSFSLA